jgi:hypothetical protein
LLCVNFLCVSLICAHTGRRVCATCVGRHLFSRSFQLTPFLLPSLINVQMGEELT